MQSNQNAVSRRTLIKGALAAGAFPGIAMAQGTALETKAAKLGFIALTDAAPLFVADEKGFFKKHGMTEVEVLKQSSWGATRDNLVLGSKSNGIDGAHIPYGTGGARIPVPRLSPVKVAQPVRQFGAHGTRGGGRTAPGAIARRAQPGNRHMGLAMSR